MDAAVDERAFRRVWGVLKATPMIQVAAEHQSLSARVARSACATAFDGLAAQVGSVLAADPFSGHVFIFRSKRADYLKILYYDGTGLCLFAKRLESGKFVWPPIVDGGMLLTPAQMALLIEAIDWRRTVAPELPRQAGGCLTGHLCSENAATAEPCCDRFTPCLW